MIGVSVGTWNHVVPPVAGSNAAVVDMLVHPLPLKQPRPFGLIAGPVPSQPIAETAVSPKNSST